MSGQENVYDLTPVPGTVTQAGTALNKANLLSDATAALLGLTGDPTVNDALAKLDLSKVSIEFGSYIGTGTYVGNEISASTLINTNINFLHFLAPIKAIYVSPTYDYVGGSGAEFLNQTYGFSSIKGASSIKKKNLLWGKNGVGWYSSSSPDHQLNTSGRIYQYAAMLDNSEAGQLNAHFINYRFLNSGDPAHILYNGNEYGYKVRDYYNEFFSIPNGDSITVISGAGQTSGTFKIYLDGVIVAEGSSELRYTFTPTKDILVYAGGSSAAYCMLFVITLG